MKTQIRYAAYSVVGITIALALLFAFPDFNRSRAKARGLAPATDLRAATTATKEEVVTLSPADLKTWGHFYSWDSSAVFPYCGHKFEVAYASEAIAGSITAGFKHSYDKGAIVLGCPDGSNSVERGTVWFDLSDIVSKAPPLHVSVERARLHFKQSGACPGELLYGTADWLKGYPDGTLVPGDHSPIATLPSGLTSDVAGSELAIPCGNCSIDVGPVVNNWVKGADHGGYANYGFVFKGMQEADLKYGNNDSCIARFEDFSLTVTYKYDTEPIITVVLPTPTPYTPVGKTPPGPGGDLETRTNYALAANGGAAKASSTYDANYSAIAANNGDVRGLHKGSDPSTGSFWHSVAPGHTFPDWLEVDFSDKKEINEIDLFTTQDNWDAPLPVTEGLTFDTYGLREFEVQYWHYKFGWTTAASYAAPKLNNLVWNKFKLSPAVQTSKIRVLVHRTDDGYSRIVELEAWGKK